MERNDTARHFLELGPTENLRRTQPRMHARTPARDADEECYRRRFPALRSAFLEGLSPNASFYGRNLLDVFSL